MQYSDIAIIFNPNSTGNAPGNADQLRADLRARLPDTPVDLLPTEHAGHAEELAYDYAKNHKRPLIISASGDGGYNEVVNGALRAQAEGAKPICAVLPSGNANDHARTMQHKPLLELILERKVRGIDVLQFEARYADGTTKTRYAHSYFGVGLTPKVAIELNRHKLNTFREALILIKSLWQLKPVHLSIEGKTTAVDSLTCSIIPEMAKVLTLSTSALPHDGLFEVTTMRQRTKATLILRLIKGAVMSLGVSRRTDTFGFTLLRPSPVQLDGEIMQLPKDASVRITICAQILQTLV